MFICSYPWVESRTCSLLCVASRRPSDRSDGNWMLSHLQDIKARLKQVTLCNCEQCHHSLITPPNLRRYPGADLPQTLYGRSARCVPRSGAGSSWESRAYPGYPGCRGRHRGGCRRWGTARSDLVEEKEIGKNDG